MTSAQKNLDRLVWFGLEITQCYDNLFYWFGLVVGWGLVISVCLKRVLVAKFFFNYPKMKMAWMCVWQIRGDHFIIYPLPRTEGADIGFWSTFCWIITWFSTDSTDMGTTQSKKRVLSMYLLSPINVSHWKENLLPYAVEYTAIWIDPDVHVRNNDVMKMPSFLVLK